MIWDIESASPLKILNAHTRSIRTISFNKIKQLLVSASIDGVIKVWDMASNICIKSIETSSKRINEIAISPNGQLIACDNYNLIVIFDLNGNLYGTLNGHDDWIYSVTFSNNGELIATGSKDKTVKIWVVMHSNDQSCNEAL